MRNKLGIVFSTIALTAIVSAATLLGSCGSNNECGPNPTNIASYYDLNVRNVEAKDTFSAYFDFSGVYMAYEDPQTAQTFDGITQKITGSIDHYNLYSLANEKVEKLNGNDLHDAANIFAKLHDPQAQGQLYAPIEKALQQIVSENGSALLVTDYEEYTPGHSIYQQAYATKYFEEWLKRGKDITFFVTDYKEGNLDKHLYYTVFDDERHILLQEIKDALKGKPVNYKEFTLSMHNYDVQPMAGGTSGAYAGPTVGGTYHDENGEDIVTASVEDGTDDGFNRLNGRRAELYTFGEPWEGIVANARSQQEQEIPLQYRFRHLLQNLYGNFSNVDSYNIKGLAVRMTDVGKDFELYMNWRTAMLHQPTTTTVEGETEVDIPSESADFYDEKGNLLPEFDYSKNGGKVGMIQGVVTFDQALYDQTFAKTGGTKAELAVNLDPRFNGTIAGNEEPSGLYRIDIIVKEAEPNIGPKIDELFAWPGNQCLSSAIRNVLQHCNPAGTAVYSYFIRIDQ